MLSLRIYIDEDLASPLLATLLRRAGHDPVLTSSVGRGGASDPIQFSYAIRHQRILLSGNHDDFAELQALVLVSGGQHPGVLIVRKDNDRSRDMREHGIVRAIGNLCKAGMPMANTLHVLNQWR